MFKELDKVEINDQAKEFVDLYQKLIAGAKWNNEMMAKGVNIDHDLFRFRKLEMRVDNLWKGVPEDQRLVIVEALTNCGVMPANLGRILKMFNGTVTRLT